MVRATFTRTRFGSGMPAAYGPARGPLRCGPSAGSARGTVPSDTRAAAKPHFSYQRSGTVFNIGKLQRPRAFPHTGNPTRGPQLSRLYKDYATITWTVNGHQLKNLIDRSTLSTVKNDGPVKVSKIAINQLESLPSDNGKFIFECTALSTRRSPRQPSRLVPSSRTPARAMPSASLAGPRAARATTSTSYPIP
ncbi:hypothetical protein HPB49_026638 [Dermacentor silvarum]|nr:hypothetical protein HPB49_026638 [Dermacentor silvarum]